MEAGLSQMQSRQRQVRGWRSVLLSVFLLLGCAGAAVDSVSAPQLAPRAPRDSLDNARRAIDAPSERVAAPSNAPRWIGVQLKPTPSGEGVAVLAVFPSSPAERAGVLSGDLLLQLNGVAVSSPDAVVQAVADAVAESSVPLVLRRAGAERLLRVALEPLPNRDQLMRQAYLGRPAPVWVELETVRGSTSPAIGDQRGRVVVLEFWASWCAVCRYMTPILNDWASHYGAQGVHVVGVIADPVEQSTSAAEDFDVEYAVFADPSGKTSVAYRATVIPTVFLIDQQGIVRDVMVGFSANAIRSMQRHIDELLDS